ncbi:hypothetical protein KY313_03040 [Candidatus Woesearchaeota archaeon]|jgi:hypothetical protein|nr:hypothetical protein [Candidatus Woesearchaeota archaeon]
MTKELEKRFEELNTLSNPSYKFINEIMKSVKTDIELIKENLNNQKYIKQEYSSSLKEEL